MSDKNAQKKPAPKADPKADPKKSETVNLSAEELRKISGGSSTGVPPSPGR
jgi:hypothetical protein